jgi:thiol-disulfide isomerase/thioredoxin
MIASKKVALAASLFLVTGLAQARAEGLQLGDFGPAPAFAGIDKWLNSQPLTIEGLKGKVVLIDFWTYSCINCLRTLPYVTKWYDTYKDKGLVVVGVHTPEFAFEKLTKNVQTAISRFGIGYPVAQDNNYATWTAYKNQYWPAEYLIDKTGKIVLEHFGEGNYDEMEDAIRKLLAAGGNVAKDDGQDLSKVASPEMYFGLERVENLASPEPVAKGAKAYSVPEKLALNSFALQGTWTLADENAELSKDGGAIALHFNSGKVFMVASSANPVTLNVTVDGKAQAPVTVQASQLYTLFDSKDYGEHELRIEIPKAGFMAYTFTFG